MLYYMYTNQRRFSNRETAFLFCIIKRLLLQERRSIIFPKNDLRANSNSYILFSFRRSIPQALYIALQSNKNLSMTYQKEKARHFHVVFFLVFGHRFLYIMHNFIYYFFHFLVNHTFPSVL